MKQFKKRYEDLRDKASHLKQIIDTAPTKAAEMRQVITQTVGEFQSLKDEFQIGTGAFPEVMEQITRARGVFREAGYELDKVEMEIGLNPRLLLFLDREDEIDLESLQVLRSEHEKAVAVRSVLDALIKGETVAARIDIPGMTFRTLGVEIGMSPCVRLFWEADPAEAEMLPPPLPLPASAPLQAPAPAPVKPSQPEKSSSYFAEGSFFERKMPPLPISSSPEPAQAAVNVMPAPDIPQSPAPLPTPEPAPSSTVTPASGSSAWKPGALDRFKKMPTLSR